MGKASAAIDKAKDVKGLDKVAIYHELGERLRKGKDKNAYKMAGRVINIFRKSPSHARHILRALICLVGRHGIHYPTLFHDVLRLIDVSALRSEHALRFLEDLQTMLHEPSVSHEVLLHYAQRLATTCAQTPQSVLPDVLRLLLWLLMRYPAVRDALLQAKDAPSRQACRVLFALKFHTLEQVRQLATMVENPLTEKESKKLMLMEPWLPQTQAVREKMLSDVAEHLNGLKSVKKKIIPLSELSGWTGTLIQSSPALS